MKKLALILAIVMVACFMFVACEKAPDDKPTGDSTPATQSTPDDTPASTPDTPASTPDAPTSTPDPQTSTSVGGGQQPGTDTPTAQDYVLDASTLTVGDLTTDTKVGIFTVACTGSSSKAVNVFASNTNATDGSKKFTQGIKLQGKADVVGFAKCIKIEAPSAGTLTWYAKNANTSDATKMANRTADLFDSTGAVLQSSATALGLNADGTIAADAKNASVGTFNIPAAGTYYFGCKENGINVYGLVFTPAA